MATFNVQSARKHGASDEEILNYLVDKHSLAGKKFDLEGALKKGHTPDELINYLSSFEPPEKLQSNIPKWGQDSPALWKAYQVGQKIKDDITRPVAEGGGAALGAEIGSAAGPLGMLAGGTLGYAISKRSMDLVDENIKKREGGGKVYSRKMTMESLKSEAIGALEDLKEGATYEMIGQTTANVLPRFIEGFTAPFSSKMSPERNFVAKEAKKYGVTLSPAEITESKSLALAESLLEKVWGATDIIRDFRLKKQLKPLEDSLRNLMETGGSKESIEAVGQKIWNQLDDYLRYEKNLKGELLENVRAKLIAKYGSEMPLTELGLGAKETIKVNTEILRNRKNKLYNDIKDSMPQPFKTSSLAKEAKAILDKKKDLPNYGLDKETVTWLKWASKEFEMPPQLEQTLAEVPPAVRESIIRDLKENALIQRDWTTAQEFKKSMETMMREDDPMRYTGLKGQMSDKGYIASRLKSAVTEDMRNAVEATVEYVQDPAIKFSDGTVVSGPYSKGGHTAIINKIDQSGSLGIDGKIVKAYQKLKNKTGFSNIDISAIRDEAGVTQQEISDFVKKRSKEGSGIASLGDMSVSDANVKSGAVKIAGRDNLLFKLKDEYKAPENLSSMFDRGEYIEGGITDKGTFIERPPGVDFAEFKGKKISDAYDKLKVADAFYGDYADVVKHKKIKALINADAGKVIDVAFQPNAIEEIRLIKRAAGVDGFLQLRQGFMNKLTGVGKKEIFDPQAFKRNLEKYGDETLNEIFGKDSAKELRNIAKDGLDLTRHNPPTAYYKSVLKEDPDFIVDKIIGAPESKLQSNILGRNLKRIRQVVDKDTFKQIQDKFTDKFFVLNQTEDLIRPVAFSKMVDKYDKVLGNFYPYEKVEQLRTLQDIARRLQKAEEVAGNPSGTGQTLISWGIFRMIMNVPGASTAGKISTALITFGPKQLAKLYKSDFGIKWLTDGFKVHAKSKKGIALAARITAILADEDKKEE